MQNEGSSTILTIYYVSAPVRDNFVSCVMSFWESDQINSSGLPFLLEQIMELTSEVVQALRAVRSSPKWTPASHAGIPVKVRFQFPLVFNL